MIGRLVLDLRAARRPGRKALAPLSRRLRPYAVALAIAALVAGVVLVGRAAVAVLSPLEIATVAVLFLAAHALRAVRLAIVAGLLLGVSARTAALLHFATAPAVLLVPLKLGEALRLHQLWVASGRLAEAAITVVVDRVMDAIMLLLLVTWLAFSASGLAGVGTLIMLTGAAVAIAAVVLLLGPPTLRSLQAYVIVHHRRGLALRGLKWIDLGRRVTERGGFVLRRQGAPLLLLSAAIWTLELTAAGLVAVHTLEPGLQEAARFLLTRVTEEWRLAIGANVDPALAASAATGLLVLLAAWPLALSEYMRRLKGEPLRRPPPMARNGDDDGA